MVGQFEKAYLHIDQSRFYISSHPPVLKNFQINFKMFYFFLTKKHLQAESCIRQRIFLHFIPVRIIIPWSGHLTINPNIKYPIEVNPSKFLDTKLININGVSKFNLYWKNTKLLSPWTSKL